MSCWQSSSRRGKWPRSRSNNTLALTFPYKNTVSASGRLQTKETRPNLKVCDSSRLFFFFFFFLNCHSCSWSPWLRSSDFKSLPSSPPLHWLPCPPPPSPPPPHTLPAFFGHRQSFCTRTSVYTRRMGASPGLCPAGTFFNSFHISLLAVSIYPLTCLRSPLWARGLLSDHCVYEAMTGPAPTLLTRASLLRLCLVTHTCLRFFIAYQPGHRCHFCWCMYIYNCHLLMSTRKNYESRFSHFFFYWQQQQQQKVAKECLWLYFAIYSKLTARFFFSSQLYLCE